MEASLSTCEGFSVGDVITGYTRTTTCLNSRSCIRSRSARDHHGSFDLHAKKLQGHGAVVYQRLPVMNRFMRLVTCLTPLLAPVSDKRWHYLYGVLTDEDKHDDEVLDWLDDDGDDNELDALYQAGYGSEEGWDE